MKLINYLKTLDSPDSSWGVYVNPNDQDDFAIQQIVFEAPEGKALLGSLDSLSYGSQSVEDAIAQFIADQGYCLLFEHKLVWVSETGIVKAYRDKRLSPRFAEYLENEAANICKQWAESEALRRVSYFLEWQEGARLSYHSDDFAS